MAQVYLDPDAIQTTQTRLRAVRDTVLHEAHRQGTLAGEVEHLLSTLGTSILDELDPLHWVDPIQHWEQSGLSRMAQAARESHVTIDWVHNQVREALERLCAVHGEFVGGRMAAHCEGVGQALGSARSLLWEMTQFFSPGNLLWFLREPWIPGNRFNEARARLEELAASIEGFVGWLERLARKEAGIIEELLRESPTLIKNWLKAHAKDMQMVGTIVEDIVTLGGVIPHMPGEVGAILDVVGFLADVAQGGQFSMRTLVVDGDAALIGAGISAIPYVGEIYDGLSIGSFGMEGVAWAIRQEAGLVDGRDRAQLLQLAGVWEEEGQAVDPGPLTHDLGALVADLQGGQIQLLPGSFDPGIGGFGDLGGDGMQTLKDAGTLVWGVATEQIVLPVDTIATNLDLIARTENAPDWIQGPLDWVAGPGESVLGDVVHFFKP